jgi:hypothetical protein
MDTAQSHLFTIRLWAEDESGILTNCRGKLHHIPSGESHYFRGWEALIPLMREMLSSYINAQNDEKDQDLSQSAKDWRDA